MNKTILKGIAEALEFNTEIGASGFSYNAKCESYNDEECQITVMDPDDPLHVQIASVKIGTVKDSDEVAVQVTWKKKQWTKTYHSWGTLVDVLDAVQGFLKECVIQIVKSL